MLKAIIFDMDGVLIDSHKAHKAAWRGFIHSLGKQISESELDFVLDGRKREEILSHFLGELSHEQLQEYGRLKDDCFQKNSSSIRVLPGLRKFLRALEREGIVKAVATSASLKRTNIMLEQLELRDHFRAIVTGSDVPNGKPDPAIFRIAAQRIGVAPAETLVIEDAVSGVRGAKAAGMRCLGVTSTKRFQQLRDAGADEVIRNFNEISVERLRSLFSEQGKQPVALAARNQI
jgi:HAD superfamily hydrolase (TIGR01509 family)